MSSLEYLKSLISIVIRLLKLVFMIFTFCILNLSVKLKISFERISSDG